MKIIARILPLFILLVGCDNASEDDLSNQDNNPNPEVKATYEADVKPILDAQCIRCHGATVQNGGIRLDSYMAARGATENGNVIDRISRPAGSAGVMPQGGKLPQASIDLIKKWQTDGYLISE